MTKTLGERCSTFETKTIEGNNVGNKPVESKSQLVKGTTENGGIRKEYLNDANLCRATFILSKEATNGAESVSIVGDFNSWNIHADPMGKTENGDFEAIFDLKPGREYQFRYLIDESRWENDWDADRYVKSCYGDSDNSVVVT